MVSPALLLVTWLAGNARAAESLAYPTQGYRLWSWTAVEGLPDRTAESQFRAQEQLAAELRFSRSLSFYGVGSVGVSPGADGPDTGQLYRMHLVYRRPAIVVEAGRLARWDVRGRHHLDGVAAIIGTGKVTADAWAGQLWHPETWSYGSTLVGGAQATWAPSAGMRAMGGAEARLADGDLGARLHLAGSAAGARGQHVLALVEGQPEEGVRASVDGLLPVGNGLELELTGRWEDLEPATLPVALESPQAWLGAEGYAAVTGGARLRRGLLFAQAVGGPTVHPESSEPLGGTSRVELGLRTATGWQAGVGAVGAGIGESWVAGGTLGGGLAHDRVDVRAEAGLFRYMPLSGGLSEVAEGRVRAELPLIDSGTLRATRRLVLVGELAAGTDRILERWMRGGLALHGTLSGPRPSGNGT